MTSAILNALPSIISAATLAAVSVAVRKTREMADDFATVREATRNQLKAYIVDTYMSTTSRGYITSHELDVVSRIFDSYVKLGGNSYARQLVEKMGDLDIKE